MDVHLEGRGVGKGLMLGEEWDICVPARLSCKHAVVEAAACFCCGGLFLLTVGQWLLVQRTCHRYFDIPPRGCIPDWKCVLMCLDAMGDVSKERKGHPKTIGTPENVERVLVSI
ncbi:hypothetical protein TNCV_1460351 [Trichonephila clavipes]|nr:hypothetical protein TNCV_1460351 [Trichonephila clavipes]